jgi:5-carboxymethyl-2-hydroxymuconate isomerase
MPHVILEYSGNIVEKADFQPLWARLHPVIVAIAGCRIEDVKSRSSRREAFRVGNGEPAFAFVHLTIRLLEGRDAEALNRLGLGVMEVLREFFAATIDQRKCDVTVELTFIRRDCYFRAKPDYLA